MRILAVATKCPLPPIGGGNLVVHELLTAMVGLGLEVRLVAPGVEDGTRWDVPYSLVTVPVRPHPWWRVAHHAVIPPPTALARFRLRPLRRAVLRELETFKPDVVHLEQLHLAWLISEVQHAAAVVLRQQNVESLILKRFSAFREGAEQRFLLREALRTEREEALACRRADIVAAISEPDAAALGPLSGATPVVVVPAPFLDLPELATPVELDGDPPLTCLGSFDWAPTREAGAWFLDLVWPHIRRRLPDAVLHLAGPGSLDLGNPSTPGVRRHGIIDHPVQLYDPRGIAVVPVRAGSGVRLRILEAWSAGVPVITTPVGGEGLVRVSGQGALLAADAVAFADMTARLAKEPKLREALVTEGRRRLAPHEPSAVARCAVEAYEQAIRRPRRETG